MILWERSKEGEKVFYNMIVSTLYVVQILSLEFKLYSCLWFGFSRPNVQCVYREKGGWGTTSVDRKRRKIGKVGQVEKAKEA